MPATQWEGGGGELGGVGNWAGWWGGLTSPWIQRDFASKQTSLSPTPPLFGPSGKLIRFPLTLYKGISPLLTCSVSSPEVLVNLLLILEPKVMKRRTYTDNTRHLQ